MALITIVGAGQMGSAMSYPARHKGHRVRLVGTPLDRDIITRLKVDNYHVNLKRTLPKGIEYLQIEDLDHALLGADVLVSGVSSFGVDWFLKEVLPHVPDSLPVLSVTKGLMVREDGTFQSYPEYYGERLPDRKLSLNAVGGPCTSYELADLDPSTVCFCGPDLRVLRRLKSLFSTDFYHISLTRDVLGLECAVAFKNLYALGVSLAIGLSEAREGKEGAEHYNSQAALFGQSIKEMRRLLQLAGVSEEHLVFGAGDLYVTVFGGRTRKIGTLLGRGLTFDDAMAQLKGVTLESIVIATRTAQAVRIMIADGRTSASQFPLLLHCDQLINQGRTVDIPWKAFEDEY